MMIYSSWVFIINNIYTYITLPIFTGLILAYKTGNFETAGKENFKNLHI